MTVGPSTPLLALSVARAPHTAVVCISGELDIASASELQVTLDRLREDPDRPELLVLDAGQLTFVDPSGLRPLLAARQWFSVRLRNVQPPVLRVLRLLDLATAFGLDG